MEHYRDLEKERPIRPSGSAITCPKVPLPVHARDEIRAHPQAWSDAARLFQEGDYAAAAMAFGAIARLGPESRRARIAQATALINLGRFTYAVRLLQGAVDEDPADPIASMNLATALFCAGRLPGALKRARRSADLLRAADLNTARPRHLQGLIFMEMGRYGRARRVLEDALEADPTFAPAALGVAQCCALESDFRGAERHLDRARRLLEQVPEEIREVSAEAIERFARHLANNPRRWKSGWRRRLSAFRRRQRKPDSELPGVGPGDSTMRMRRGG